MHKCPSCDREFERIFDYPLVHVVKFERLPISSELVLPDFGYEIFVGPDSRCGNRRPPQEVLDFFKANKKEEEFEHKGYTWYKQGDWNFANYRKGIKNAKDIIMAQINPYFENLEKLVGKEVSTKQILPSFGKTRDDYCRIPDTRYDLTLEESSDSGFQMLTQNNLPVPNLETAQPTEKLAFCITKSNGGSISEVHFLATLGGLAYEGRTRK